MIVPAQAKLLHGHDGCLVTVPIVFDLLFFCFALFFLLFLLPLVPFSSYTYLSVFFSISYTIHHMVNGSQCFVCLVLILSPEPLWLLLLLLSVIFQLQIFNIRIQICTRLNTAPNGNKKTREENN